MARPISLINRIIGAIVLLLLLLVLTIWAFSPMIVRSYAPQFLEPLGLQLTNDTQIRLNPFKVALNIQELGIHALDQDAAQASIQDGIIDVSLLALMQKTLSFDELSFETLRLDVSRDEQLVIAGYTISPSETNTEEEDQAPKAESESQWSVDIAELAIADFTANVDDQGNAHEIHLEALSLRNITFAEAGLNIELDLSARLNDAPLKSDIHLDFSGASGRIEFDAELSNFAMAPVSYLASPHIQHLEGLLSLKTGGEILQDEAGLIVNLNESEFGLRDLSIQESALAVRNRDFNLELSRLELVRPTSGQITVETDFSVTNSGLELAPTESQDILLAVDELELPENAFSLSEDASFVTALAQINVSDIRFSDQHSSGVDSDGSEASDAPALVLLDQLKLQQVQASSNSLSIEDISLGALEVTAYIDENQQVANLVALSREGSSESDSASQEQVAAASTDEEEEAAPSEENDQASEKNAPFNFSLGRFNLAKQGTVNLSYRGMSPAFEQTFYIDRATLEKLDTKKPNEFSKLDLAVSSGKYTKISTLGDIAPFSEQVNLALDLTVREFELPKISPFIRTAAGFDMANGQLDSDTKIAIVNDEISGTSELIIRGLEIDNAGDAHTGSVSEQSFIPLNLALGALEDTDGRIEIDVPLRGNVNSPNFGVEGFVGLVAQRAALMASKSYLINSFVPYASIVQLSVVAGSYALKPSVDDMLFSPTQGELLTEQNEFLDKLAALLIQKESIDMKLCGFAVMKEVVESGEPTAEQLGTLRALALARAENSKSYLVEQHAISSARLLLCEAKLDQRVEAQPRVEFEF